MYKTNVLALYLNGWYRYCNFVESPLDALSSLQIANIFSTVCSRFQFEVSVEPHENTSSLFINIYA